MAKPDRNGTPAPPAHPASEIDKSYFDINRMELVAELDVQTRLYGEAAFALADAKRDHAERKAKLDVVEAEAAALIRQSPDAYGLKDRPSNEAVTLTTKLQPAYQKALAREIAAKHKVDVYAAHVATIEHRKRVIEMQLDLLKGEFWSMVKIPQDDTRTPVVPRRGKSNVRGERE